VDERPGAAANERVAQEDAVMERGAGSLGHTDRLRELRPAVARWRHGSRALLAVLFVGPLAATDATAQQWIAAWSVAQGADLTSPALSGHSVRIIVRPTLAGNAVRMRLENTLGQSPVEFSGAYVGQVQSGAALVPGSNVQVTFNGNAGVTLEPGGSVYSDPVAFTVAPFERYAISLNVRSASDISAHMLGLVTNYMAAGAHAADASGAGFTPLPGETGPAFPVYWVAALDVPSPSTTGTIVAFGDSITDGECSTRTNNGAASGHVLPDLYDRWTDLLAQDLAAMDDTYLKAVANEGIAGNRLLPDSGGVGPAGLDRMTRDMLDREGVRRVILFEGTNDIANGAAAADVIAADQTVIERAHAAGLTILGAAIIPRGGNHAWTSGMEQQRVALNDWIRHQARFDGVIDFDSAMQGPVNATNQSVTLPTGLSCFDGVHPNAAGYAAMAGAIRLDLFKVPPTRRLSLSWVPGSTTKLEQLIGDEDYETKQPTLSQTDTRYRVAGTDLGYSFPHRKKQIFLFGDSLYFSAGDTMAWSTSTDPGSVALSFFPSASGSTLLVEPPGINMGAFNVPDSGISLLGKAYVVVKTNHTVGGDTDASYLTRFHEASSSFEVLRNYAPISQRPAGKFIEMALQTAFLQLNPRQPIREEFVLMWGSGEYRKSDVYLAMVPTSNFESGAGTTYLTGVGKRMRTSWSAYEVDANAVVTDGTIGNVSVTRAPGLGLWLMTYDSRAQGGVVFRYSTSPWGPWSAPQVIFDPVRDGGFGHFIHDPAITPDDGLDGPTIGGNDPFKTRGGNYAPYMIERFTKVEGGRLSIYYVMSTWNPYTVVLMQSQFTIVRR
jgi:lysophospholipase L1-like esterase